MKKVLCIGEALIDMICTDRGTNLSKGQNFLKKAGGAPANVAAAIAALGGGVDMAAKVGKDPFGVHIIELLKEMGVDTQWVLKDEKHFILMVLGFFACSDFIVNENLEENFKSFPGTSLMCPKLTKKLFLIQEFVFNNCVCEFI